MIVVCSDHRGYEKKTKLLEYFKKKQLQFIDLGTTSSEIIDSPDFVDASVKQMRKNPRSIGVFICGSGFAVSIAANKYQGIYAAACLNVSQAKRARLHNDANVLCLASEYISLRNMCKMIDAFLQTNLLSEERYARRIAKIEKYYLEEVKRIKS